MSRVISGLQLLHYFILLMWFVACDTTSSTTLVETGTVTGSGDTSDDGGREESGLRMPDAEVASLARMAKGDRRMAITVDDLPVAFFDDFRESERREIIQAWRELLERRQLPVTGFFISRNIERQPELFNLWRETGISFGNHSFSHPRLQKIGLKAFLRDLSRGHESLAKRLPPGTTIPFRYPYLYRGFSDAERVGVRNKLHDLESPLAPVTVNTRDYYYARRYTAARRARDTELIERIRRAWLWDLEESTECAEWRARELFGREPPQILLIHANELNARHLDEYLDWLVERDYRFISLAEALADPAYQEEDRALVPTGDSLWLRLRRSRQLDL